MTFFFDASLSENLAALARILGYEAIPLAAEHARATKDIQWLLALRGTDRIVVTADHRIRRNPVERKALRRAGVTSIFFDKEFPRTPIAEQMAWMGKHWDKVADAANRAERGTVLYVTLKGNISELD